MLPSPKTLLAQVADTLGHPVAPSGADAVRAVPRDRSLPDRIRLRDGNGGYALCDRAVEPERWGAAAFSDAPLVTRIKEDADGFQEPTSSASAPATVLRMLEEAGIADGQRVLETGTGTGYHAALLAHRLGDGHVVSVEIDSALADTARAALKTAGRTPTVVTGDGALGHAAAAPYDRIIATCSVRAVPAAWLAQTRPGARLVVPWSTSWITYGTLVLTRRPDGTADGRFGGYGSYMVMRGQRAETVLDRDLVRDGQRPGRSETALSPWAVAGGDLDARFAVGLRVPDVRHSWDTATDEVHTRLWPADDAATSWASVDHDGRRTAAFSVRQHGPRRLWDEVAAAHRQWIRAGGPRVAGHGLAVTADGHEVRVQGRRPPPGG
ncbi:methyltransferase domain-containing protein [Streptomyces albofaciens JCM 4342]|uniref:methyltransferase domain-containing protein n=1 Tax=Streptomyces albofaciens TaxID=66866 RepID=UPI00123A1ED5|nr:methyltransferase domain-containing protein [Streptomyces albofaciens]KAA6213604.1 methyltransferase domain-containing protein [Streptomyces albofaciens JCM 4342]